jgi:hypothetical protein
MNQIDVDKVHKVADLTSQALHTKEDHMREVELAITNWENGR